ncbi:MAG: hypothetical protein ACI8TP_001747 [Acidimicrobiales bacterium]|jgi:hypothetical protein
MTVHHSVLDVLDNLGGASSDVVWIRTAREMLYISPSYEVVWGRTRRPMASSTWCIPMIMTVLRKPLKHASAVTATSMPNTESCAMTATYASSTHAPEWRLTPRAT